MKQNDFRPKLKFTFELISHSNVILPIDLS